MSIEAIAAQSIDTVTFYPAHPPGELDRSAVSAAFHFCDASNMASFPLFPCFPVEIQLAIWAFAAVLDPEPEVCLVWPSTLETWDASPDRPADEPALPFIVDTDWPAVAHVCRVAREAAFKSGRLRYSPLAGFAVPYRHFMPAIDTLYCGQLQYVALCLFLNRPENAHIARDLRRLALEIAAPFPLSNVAEVIRKSVIDLRTLSLVFPGTMNLSSPTESFHRPTRRCKLRNIAGDSLDEITIAQVLDSREGKARPMTLRKYLDHQRAALDRHVREGSIHGDEGTAWSTNDNSFSGLEITAQTFVEYHCNQEEQWIEVCRDRLLSSPDLDMMRRPLYVWPADRKNPEEHRVIDDDSRLYSVEEFMEGWADSW